MLFFYKFFTFSQPFSQLPNKFYITKSTTTHTSAPTENPLLSTQNPPPQNIETTKTPPPRPPQKKKKKIEIKERKQIGDEIDLEEEIDRRVADDEINPEEEMI